jgi:long-chain acyl-CoA synthetase
MASSRPSIAEVHATLTAPGQMFEMEEVAIRGIPTRTWKNAPPSLRAVLEQSRGHGDKVFLVYEDERTTFEEHYRQAATLAHRLIDDFGVVKGDRVAIAMRNFPEWSVAFWAAACVGAVIVPLNAWWTAPELEYGLSDSSTKVAFLDQERAERLDGAAGLPAHMIVARGAHGSLPRFEDVLGTVSADAVAPDVAVDPEDDATIFYTSGTTGQPKGALGTQRNICGNLMSLIFSNARSTMRKGASPAVATRCWWPTRRSAESSSSCTSGSRGGHWS